MTEAIELNSPSPEYLTEMVKNDESTKKDFLYSSTDISFAPIGYMENDKWNKPPKGEAEVVVLEPSLFVLHTPNYRLEKGIHEGNPTLGIKSDISWNTLCQKLYMPIDYIRRCPSWLIVTQLNYWIKNYVTIKNKTAKDMFIRTRMLDNNMYESRAFLSSQYYSVSNLAIVESIIQNAANRIGKVWIADEGFSCALEYSTEAISNMNFRIFLDIVNSDVGTYAFGIRYRLVWRGMDFLLPERIQKDLPRPINASIEVSSGIKMRHVVGRGKDIMLSLERICGETPHPDIIQTITNIYEAVEDMNIGSEKDIEVLRSAFGKKYIDSLEITVRSKRVEIAERIYRDKSIECRNSMHRQRKLSSDIGLLLSYHHWS